jgi:D-alanyl-D-alanine carboxypeptidase (penicillin-binding protein 5/6)
MRILNYGFRFYETIKLSETNTRLGDVQVWGGRQDMVSMAVAEERFVTLQSGQKSALQREIDVSANLVAPISAGQSLGVVKYKLDEQVIAEVPLVALESVERGSFFTRTADSIKRMMR